MAGRAGAPPGAGCPLYQYSIHRASQSSVWILLGALRWTRLLLQIFGETSLQVFLVNYEYLFFHQGKFFLSVVRGFVTLQVHKQGSVCHSKYAPHLLSPYQQVSICAFRGQGHHPRSPHWKWPWTLSLFLPSMQTRVTFKDVDDLRSL